MKRYTNIEYHQQPVSYWQDADILAALLRNVKGRERRQMIRTHYQQGRLEELDETFLRDTLSEKERDQLGKIHPAFMGGEYLPDYRGGEVEIASIELQSTTSDVISIRAKKQGKRIAYRIVDEYGTVFELARKTSQSPLTLQELIRLIDGSVHPDIGMGLALCYNEMNAAEGCRARYRSFTRVNSDFYPQLTEHYEHVYNDWVDEEQPEAGEGATDAETEEADGRPDAD